MLRLSFLNHFPDVDSRRIYWRRALVFRCSLFKITFRFAQWLFYGRSLVVLISKPAVGRRNVGRVVFSLKKGKFTNKFWRGFLTEPFWQLADQVIVRKRVSLSQHPRQNAAGELVVSSTISNANFSSPFLSIWNPNEPQWMLYTRGARLWRGV